MTDRIIIIAGGIGAGKSVVADIVRAMGYPVYDTDENAKYIRDNSPEIIARIARDVCPAAVKDGTVDKDILSACVFADRERLLRLNAIIHEAVIAHMEGWLAFKDGLRFIETALLHEAGLAKFADEIWMVTAPEKLRVQRVMARNGLTEEQVLARIHAQNTTIPDNAEVIYNDDITPLLPQIMSLLEAANNA